MKNTRFTAMKNQLLLHLAPESGPQVLARMDGEYQQLCTDFAGRPEALQSHLHNNIFPVVTAFHSLMALGMERQTASQLAQDVFLELMEAPAQSIRKALRVPGLHRIIPWVFKTMMPKLFGEDAGFRFTMYPTGRREARFDMTACPYFAVCRELDCPELAPVFCATDDTCYGNMHPNLIWNRTKTLARGGDCCDFDLYLQK